MKKIVNAAYLNNVTLLGNVGYIDEIKEFDSGVCNLAISIATEKVTKTSEPKTVWHNIVVWGNTAKAVKKFVNKGDKLLINGEIDSRKSKNKDGVETTWVTINANKVTFISLESNDKNDKEDNDISPKSDFYNQDIPF